MVAVKKQYTPYYEGTQSYKKHCRPKYCLLFCRKVTIKYQRSAGRSQAIQEISGVQWYDKLMTQMSGLIEGHVLLDQSIQTRKNWLSMLAVVCKGHEILKFIILRGGNKAVGRIISLDFKRADFYLLRNLFTKIL